MNASASRAISSTLEGVLPLPDERYERCSIAWRASFQGVSAAKNEKRLDAVAR
jgi:hypothetical protein